MLKRPFMLVFALLLVISIPFLFSCSRVGSSMSGTGNIIDQELSIADFTRIQIHGEFSVQIQQATTFSVTVSTDDNLMNRIRVSREGETLKMDIEAPGNFFPTSLKVTITMPRIYELSLSGKANASLSGFQSTFNFDLRVSEGSTLTGDLESGITRFDVSEASQVALAGKALELELEASGKSKMDFGQFEVVDASASLKESSEALMNITGEFDVELNGASRMYYLGNPVIKDSSISADSILQQK
jgi:hypothetical protein